MRYSERNSRGRVPLRRIAIVIAGVVCIALAIPCVMLAVKWPFSREAISSDVAKRTGWTVQIANFRSTFFPPGFVADGIELKDRASGIPVFTAREIRVRANYIGLLLHHLQDMTVSGFHFAVHRPAASESHSRSLTVGKLIAENGSLEVPSTVKGKPPLQADIHHFVLDGIGESHSTFELAAASPRLHAELKASGSTGRLTSKSADKVPVAGNYVFSNANVAEFGDISGILSSSGSIGGTLGHLKCNGAATIPDFHVGQSAHRVRLESRFTAVIDTTGDGVELQNITVGFNRTTVVASGRAASDKPGTGKTLRLTARMDQGRVEDLLVIFSQDPHPGMTGQLALQAGIELPPAPPGFLERIKIDGGFTIRGALFTNPKTQAPLNYLSESSRGESRNQERDNPTQIPGEIHGDAHASDGLARLTDVRYSSPGVNVSLAGTFNPETKAISFRGLLATSGELTDGTSVLKSVLMHVARPFTGVRKHGKITTAPFVIAGTSGHPVLSLSTSKPLNKDLHKAVHTVAR